MQDNNLNFAKIVSIPTLFAWSQAYNAGKLFAVLSLKRESEHENKDFLNLLGKEVLETLEQEYFTLETKDLNSIKNAVLVTAKKIPDDVEASLVVASVIGNVLYTYAFGKGKVDLKRDGKMGTILEKNEEDKDVKSASGYLHGNDVIVLQTKQFAEQVSADELSSSIDSQSPDDVVESLAPALQEKGEGGASAIILKYKSEEKPDEDSLVGVVEDTNEESDETKSEKVEDYESEDEKDDKLESTNEDVEVITDDKPDEPKEEDRLVEVRKESMFFPVLDKVKSMKYDGNHSRRVIMTVVALLIILFVGSVFLAIKKQNDAKAEAAFNEIYVEAQKKYDEGQNLVGLNESLARDSFTTAKTLLEEGKSQFSKGSEEQKRIDELLSKVNSSLSGTSGSTSSDVKEVDKDASDFLAYQLDNDGAYFSKEDTTLYILDNDGVYTTPLGQDNAKKIVEEDLLGDNPVATVPYIGRIYVLDKGEQIYRLTKSGDTYTSADYFTGTVDLDNAVAMAIDGSVWLLFSDGNVEKYTRGTSDNLSITGLEKDLKAPTKIFTDADTDDVYILDRGNSRIVVLEKTGKFKAEYPASVIKNATDFEVAEGDKKIYILSGNKIYEIGIK